MSTRKDEQTDGRQTAVRAQFPEKRERKATVVEDKVETKVLADGTKVKVASFKADPERLNKRHILKIGQQGNSSYVRLTKELRDNYGFKKGQQVHAVETPDGLLLRQYDPEFSRKLKAYRRTSSKFRNALRELAK